MNNCIGVKTAYVSIIIFLIIIILYLFSYLYVINEVNIKRKESVPEWLTGLPLEIFRKKVHREVYFSDTIMFLHSILHPSFKNKMSWCKFEELLEDGVDLAQNCDYIVGIASGGAIVAQYLSYRSGVPFSCIKVSRYGEKSFVKKVATVAKSTSQLEVEILEDIPPLREKLVLLVDDFAYTGKTLEFAKKYVEQQGANCITMVLGEHKRIADFHMTKNSYSGTPWGYDA